MSDYKRGDPIPYLNDGAKLFSKPARRAEKSADPRAHLAVLEKQRADILSKHQRTLMQFHTRAVKSGAAGELETLEQQLADVESEIKATRGSIAGFGEYLDGHVSAVKTQHEQRAAAQRQDAGWDWLLQRGAPAQAAPAQKTFGGARGQYDESKHPRRPKGSPGGGKFAPKGGGAGNDDEPYLISRFNHWADVEEALAQNHHLVPMKGDNGQYWLVRPEVATRLQRDGKGTIVPLSPL